MFDVWVTRNARKITLYFRFASVTRRLTIRWLLIKQLYMVKNQRETKREETGTANFKGGMVLVQFNARLLLKKNIYLWFIFQAYVTSLSEALNT
jgi:hypothetical protein